MQLPRIINVAWELPVEVIVTCPEYLQLRTPSKSLGNLAAEVIGGEIQEFDGWRSDTNRGREKAIETVVAYIKRCQTRSRLEK